MLRLVSLPGAGLCTTLSLCLGPGSGWFHSMLPPPPSFFSTAAALMNLIVTQYRVALPRALAYRLFFWKEVSHNTPSIC